MSYHHEAILEIICKDEKLANAIINSLLPDNKPLPKGMKIKMKIKEKRIIVNIISNCTLDKTITAIDDILVSANTACSALGSVEKGERDA
jgi:hypothetical protein